MGSRVLYELNPDSFWTLENILQATLINDLRWFAYVLGGSKGAEPERIGASWMKKPKNTRNMDAMAMPIDELMERLARPRKGVNDGRN